MIDVKQIRIAPITREAANECIRKWHYSGKFVNNSQLHLGAFADGQLLGAMQFGPPLDKSKLIGLVSGTAWNGFCELNRMAFSDELPRNSESRCIAIAMRMLRKNAPHIKWVVSFSDGTQCGDGAIYRASGFVLTGIKKNSQIWATSEGEVSSEVSTRTASGVRAKLQKTISRTSSTKGAAIAGYDGGASMKQYIEAGFKPLDGFQMRYVYFVDPSARKNLIVPLLPFSTIAEMGATMYLGQKPLCVRSADSGTGAQSQAAVQVRPERSDTP